MKKDILKISDVKKALASMGVRMSIDNIRKLELQGIVEHSLLPIKNSEIHRHRYFTQEQFNKSVRNICYYSLGATIEEIRANGEILKQRGRKILKIAKSLAK